MNPLRSTQIPKYPNTQARKKPEARMTNQGSEGRDDGPNKPYDLEEPTALFGEAAIDDAKKRRGSCI
jgi:hypothetical protein